jgi:hypothetical protein
MKQDKIGIPVQAGKCCAHCKHSQEGKLNSIYSLWCTLLEAEIETTDLCPAFKGREYWRRL